MERIGNIYSTLLTICIFFLGTVSTTFGETHFWGFAQNRLLIPQKGKSTFRVDRLDISARTTFNEYIKASMNLYFHRVAVDEEKTPFQSNKTFLRDLYFYIESVYIDFNFQDTHRGLPWKSILRVGKGRNFCLGMTPTYYQRRTSDYSLVSEAFNKSRITGLQSFNTLPILGDAAEWNLNIAFYNGLKLNSRVAPEMPVEDQPVAPFFTDHDQDRDVDSSKEVSFRTGIKNALFTIGFGGAFGKLTDDDLEFFNAMMFPADTLLYTDDDTRSRMILDTEIKKWGFVGQLQYILAETSLLEQTGFEVLGGYEKPKWGAYIRYGMVSGDTVPGAIPVMYGTEETGNLSQIMLSGMYRIHPRVHLRAEYLMNSEDENEVDNDIFFIEIFSILKD